MRRYKLAIHILVILSVFNFVPVLAAPIPVRRAREASTDVVGGGDDMVIVSGKRAEEGEDTWAGNHGSTQASPDSESMSLQLSQHPRGSPSTTDYASGAHQEMTNPAQLQSSAPRDLGMPPYESGGTELPWNSPGAIQRPKYASGGTGLPWISHNKPPLGTSVRTKPGTGPTLSSSGRILPASSSNVLMPPYESGGTKLLWNSPGGLRRPPFPSGGTELPWYSHNKPPPGTSVRTKPGTGPTSSSPGRIVPASSSNVLPPSKQGGYLPQTLTKQPIPQSKSSLSDLAKSWFSKPVANLKFWRRISATAKARRSRSVRYTKP